MFPSPNCVLAATPDAGADTPYCLFSDALAESKEYIHINPGSYAESVEITRNVTIVGDGFGTVSVDGTLMGRATFLVSGDVKVVFRGITIMGADGTTGDEDGVRCEQSTLGLRVEACEIRGNKASGIETDRCNLVVRQSYISGNERGGIYIDSGDVDISNTMIWDNGSGAGSWGGIRIAALGRTVRLQNNTLAANQASAGTAGSAMTCISDVASTNTIIFDHTGTLFGGTCTFSFSDVQDSLQPGTENISIDPKFIGGGNYHLMADSPCRNEGTSVGVSEFDIDGEPRNVGGVDIGADEIQ